MQLTDRGTIAPGQLADLLVVSGNPAQDPAALDHIQQVWHRGRQVPGPLAGQAATTPRSR